MGNSGHPVVRTPHLDRLAEQSYAFDSAYCNSPICTPSRLSLLTGRFPHQIGAWDLGAIADRQYQTWGDYLTEAGYETVRLCYADEHISTELTGGSAFLTACWTTCLDGATQLADHHGARQTSDEVPTRTSPSADPETTNTRNTTKTPRIWQWISFTKKRLHQTTNRFCSIAASCIRTSH